MPRVNCLFSKAVVTLSTNNVITCGYYIHIIHQKYLFFQQTKDCFYMISAILLVVVVVVVWKGIHSRSDTNRTGAKSLSFYYPRILHCPDQMLAVMLLSQHRVISSKIVRSCAPCSA